MSGAMAGFLECLEKVDKALSSTAGLWFFDFAEHPTMIDFIYVSHVERMLASTAFWKGLNLRSKEYREKFPALNAWIDAFEKRECYLAFKSDYYTHVKDIPPQYGPGYDGGFEDERLLYQSSITGKKGSWKLPLSFDDSLQPLYRGPPLPLCVLKAASIRGDNGEVASEATSYEKAEPGMMEEACRQMAGWKLAGNGQNVAKFAARGGPEGGRNPRKGFGAELADPYAMSDEQLIPSVEIALQAVCRVLLAQGGSSSHDKALTEMKTNLQTQIRKEQARDVVSCLEYLRDRVGVPRDLPLAAARQLRAHLNAAIDVLL
jgi:glutathione S-transferase